VVEGNVGIGTTSPEAKLDVAGGIHFFPETTYRSGNYGYSYNAPTASNSVDLGSHSFCALGGILHDGTNGGFCDVYYVGGGRWRLDYGKWQNGGINCRVVCIN
jgi:hypothetical protein